MWNGEALKGLCISRFMDGFLFEFFDAGLLVLIERFGTVLGLCSFDMAWTGSGF